MSKIETYYDSGPEIEWRRLERHRTEFAETMLALREYLPDAPATILDIGGGPGRYAIALTQLRHAVTLLDLSQANLAFAQNKAQEAGVELAAYVYGNALDLSQFPSESYDAVLLMGPLYHLLEAEKRERAIQEALRVLKTGGRLFAAFITRLVPIRFAAITAPSLIIEDREQFGSILASGVYRREPDQHFSDAQGFIDAYFAHHHEIRPLMEQFGLRTLDLIACEGMISRIEEKVNALTGEAWEEWVKLNYTWGKDPALHGTAEHLLYVGQKM
jgi:S-adenosylmethionine-dependent methyltransferase